MFGIRTPWTLADVRVWQGTHPLGRWACMAGGLALVIAALMVPDPVQLAPLTVAAVLGMVLILVVASYVLWHRRNNLTGRSS